MNNSIEDNIDSEYMTFMSPSFNTNADPNLNIKKKTPMTS
jgi:hypothetical protein